MNGRLYDPLVGRFLSVDPYIQNPGFTQEYNRYSYCLNNPLRYTDPSGYKKAPVKEDAFIMDYANYWNRRMLHGGGGGGGGSGGWFSAYTEASRKGYQGEATGFMNDYYNQVYAPDYNGTMSFHYFTNYSKEDQALEPGCNVLGATAYSVRHDFTINAAGQGGMTGLPENNFIKYSVAGTSVWAGTIQTGFAAAKKIQPTVSTWIKGANVFGKTSNFLGVVSITYDFATGTANSSTIANGLFMAGGATVLFFGGVALAPWVAGAGVVYGIVSVAGGEAWLNRKIDMRYINIVKPSKY